MRFFTSDTHFGHANIIKYCNRPFNDVHHMNEMLIRNWNDTVSPDDTVFHLGDVALGPWAEWDSVLSRLNGNKVLVVGNHDRIFAGEKEKMRKRFEPIYRQWFDFIYHCPPAITIGGTAVINLCHFPYDGDSHDEDRYTEYRLHDEGTPLVHGHTHLDVVESKSEQGTPQFHVGVDAHDYRPVPETTIEEWVRGL